MQRQAGEGRILYNKNTGVLVVAASFPDSEAGDWREIALETVTPEMKTISDQAIEAMNSVPSTSDHALIMALLGVS